MKPLDELRLAIASALSKDESVYGALDAFAAAHPFFGAGICDPECPAHEHVVNGWVSGAVRHSSYCPRIGKAAPTGQPCPVLAARKEADDE